MPTNSIYNFPISDELRYELDHDCTFCAQFRDKESKGLTGSIFGESYDRVLFEDEQFVIVPAIGQIVEGYLLIIPKKHFTSIFNMPLELRQQFLQLKDKVTSVLTENYSAPVFFEHGACSANRMLTGGACILHAHIHAVPIDIEVKWTSSKVMNLNPIERVEGLWEANISETSAYLYFESAKEKFYGETNEMVPSQFFRKLIAHQIGKPDIWDWRRNVDREKFTATVKRLKGKF